MLVNSMSVCNAELWKELNGIIQSTEQTTIKYSTSVKI